MSLTAESPRRIDNSASPGRAAAPTPDTPNALPAAPSGIGRLRCRRQLKFAAAHAARASAERTA